MTNAELAKKNLLSGLWSTEMIDALASKGKLKSNEVATMKAELAKKNAEKKNR